MWLQLSVVGSAGVLFVVAGILGLILWIRRHREKRAKWLELQNDVTEIKTRRTRSDVPSGKLSVQQIRDKVRQGNADDPANRPAQPPSRTEDDYPTTRIPRIRDDDPEQTARFVPRVRPYLGVRRWDRQ